MCHLREVPRAWLEVVASEAFIPLSVINLSASRGGDNRVRRGLPANHPTPPFPIFTTFEPSIASDELLQDGVELICGTKAQLQSVHKGGKILRPLVSLVSCTAEITHLSCLSDPLAGLWTGFARVFYRRGHADFDAMQGSWGRPPGEGRVGYGIARVL